MGNSSSRGGVDEQCLAPWGLYPELVWDKPTQKAVKKLILDRKLAPFFPPAESKTSPEDEECPICFMYYRGGLNHPLCCKGQRLCTECYLQVRTGPKKDVPTCPFCNKDGLEVAFEGAVTEEQLRQQEEEEQKVLELQIRMREDEIRRDQERQAERERRRAAGLPDLGPMTLDANGEIVAASAPTPPTQMAAPARMVPSAAAGSDNDGDDPALSELLVPERLGDLPPGAPGGRQWEIQQLEDIMMSEAIARSMAMEQAAAQTEAEAAERTPPAMVVAAAADRAAATDVSFRDHAAALTCEMEQAMRETAAADRGSRSAPRPVPEIATVSEGPDEALLAEAETDDEDLKLALQLSLMSTDEFEEVAQHVVAAAPPPGLADSPTMGTPPRISSRSSPRELRLEASPVDRLPSGWESAVSRRTGEVYFVNTITGERTFEHPAAARLAPARSASRRSVSPVRIANTVAPPAAATALVAATGSPVSPFAMGMANTGDERQWIDGNDDLTPLSDTAQQPSRNARNATEPSDYVVDTGAYTVDANDYTVDAAPDTRQAREPAPEPEQVPSATPAAIDAGGTQAVGASRNAVVAQFVEVCGTDETTARFTLASVGFDLQRAIDRHLSSDTSPDETLSAPPSVAVEDELQAEPHDVATVQQPAGEPELQPQEVASQQLAANCDGLDTTPISLVNLSGEGTVDGAVDASSMLEVEMLDGDRFDQEGDLAISNTAAESLQAPPTVGSAWVGVEDDDAQDVDDEAAGVDTDLALALELSKQLESGAEAAQVGAEPLADETSVPVGGGVVGGGATGGDSSSASIMAPQAASREPTRAWID